MLTGVLASDVQTLNGVSTEGLAIIVETFFALGTGIIIGFIFNWKISLVALGCTPFMMLGGTINAKFQAGLSEFDEKAFKDANLLAGDAIMNYRTVASFAHDNIIIKEYDAYLDPPTQKAIKRGHIIGLSFGLAQFI